MTRTVDGHLVRYTTAPRPNFWAAVRMLVADVGDAARLIEDALRDVPGIAAAFIFGSTAMGEDRADSDVDLFVLEEPALDERALYRQLAEAGLILDRPVNTVRFTHQTLADRLGNPTHAAHAFVRDVLGGPKRWVAGTAVAIQPLATAAGLRLADAFTAVAS